MKAILFQLTLIFLLATVSSTKAQTSWGQAEAEKKAQLNILYLEQKPYIFKEDGEFKGIEADILKEFAAWLKENKGVSLSLNFKSYETFEAVADRIEVAVDNTVALASFSIKAIPKRHISFSAPYLRNISVLLSPGFVTTTRKKENIHTNFSRLYGTTIKGSVHYKNLKQFRTENNLNRGSILYVDNPMKVVETIAKSKGYYGYTDIISFWKYLQNHDEYIKMHKIANVKNMPLAFAFPAQSDWVMIFNEFMESGFGFPATKRYDDILDQYLGYEIKEKVAID